MIARIDQWRSLRRQRYQELQDRQQAVQAQLAAQYQTRQAQAVALHQELRQFRHALAADHQQRKSNLQQFCDQLHFSTQEFLAQQGETRRLTGQQVAASLDQFVLNLETETAEFLALTTQNRHQMATELAQDLQTFRETLQTTVASLRQALQEENRCRQVDVADYLQELELMREERAQELHRMLSQNRQQRLADVQELFERLGEFRGRLQHCYLQLQEEIWGVSRQPQVIEPRPKPVTPAPAPAPVPPSQLKPKPTLPPKPTVIVEPPQPCVETLTPLEQNVYDCIQNSQGARLGEIETSLNINRVETVDVLRSLLKKGLVTQRDRAYFVKETEAG